MAINYGRQGTETVLQANRFHDVSDIVYLKHPDESPVTTLMTALGKVNVGDPEFKWFNKDRRAASVVAGNTGTSGTTSHIFGTAGDASLFVPEDIIRVVDFTTGILGEAIRVVAVDTGTNTITISRGAAGSTPAAFIATDIFLRVANAQTEGSSLPTPNSQQLIPYTNNTQIVRHSSIYTRTFLESNKFHAGMQNGEIWNKREEKRKEHVRDVNTMFHYGLRGIENAGSDLVRRYTGGIEQFITDAIAAGVDNTQSVAAGNLDYATFEDFLGEKAFAFGSTEKWGLCPTKTISVLNMLTKDHIRIENIPTEFGLKVTRFHSTHGVLNLVRDDTLNIGEYANSLVIIDPDHMEIKHVGSGMTRFKTDVGLESDDDRKDQWLTEAGLKVAVPETLAKLTNILAAV